MSNSAHSSTTQPKPLRLLSLDGGGVRSICTLLILDAIMDEVGVLEGQNDGNKPLPVDYFDLAGGTSAGGLLALMLFRLRMSTSDAISKFEEIAKDVFSPRIGDFNLHDLGDAGYFLGNPFLVIKSVLFPSRFPGEPLTEAIDKLMEASKIDDDDRNRKGNSKLRKEGSGRMFLCATRVDQGESVLFRSYTPPKDAGPSVFEDVSISDAACATAAAPTFLPSVNINGVDFWDGALLNNNPINQVWEARYDLAPPLPVGEDEVAEEPVVSCIVSIGTGYHTEKEELPTAIHDTIQAAISYSMNTKAKDQDFERSIARLRYRRVKEQRPEYFRFDARVSESVNIDDYKRMEILKDDTKRWLGTKEAEEKIKKCAKLLC